MPCLSHRDGRLYLSEVPAKPSLRFARGTGYLEALRALLVSVVVRGELPAGTVVQAPLRSGRVFTEASGGRGPALDLRAPFGCDPGPGQIAQPTTAATERRVAAAASRRRAFGKGRSPSPRLRRRLPRDAQPSAALDRPVKKVEPGPEAERGRHAASVGSGWRGEAVMSRRPTSSSLLGGAIVGRAAVLDRLDELMDASADGGGVVAIAGEAGLGKTRLARALVADAQRRGRSVMVGRASPLAAALPLGVIQDALREERRARASVPVPGDPLAAAFPAFLLPELGTGERAPDMDRGALFEAAARYVRARSAPDGLLLVLEDLHWADATSHALIAFLARATRDAPILIALTYRPDEAPSGCSLDLLRHELARERLGEELLLGPLAAEDVALMLRDIVGLDLDDEVRAMVARASGGNPFVVEELVRDAVAEERLELLEGRWSLDEPIALPGTVQEMLLRRVRALDRGDRELLRWAAVLGERFDVELLAPASGLTGEAALDALGRLHEAGVIAAAREAGDGRLAFRHALTREAVLGDLLDPDRRRRHARVLEVADAPTAETRPLPLDEALEHALAAGDRARSLDLSSRAASRAVDLGGYQEARAHSERGLALWRPDDGLPMRARLLMRLGFLTSHVGGGLQMWQLSARSRRHFEEAHALYEELGDTTSAALALAGAVWSREVTDVLDDLRRARDGLGPGAAPDAVCQVLCRLGDREFLVGQPRAALRTCAEGLALLKAQTGDEDPWYFPRRAQLHRWFGLTSAVATWWLGASGRAAMLAIADEALSANDRGGPPSPSTTSAARAPTGRRTPPTTPSARPCWPASAASRA